MQHLQVIDDRSIKAKKIHDDFSNFSRKVSMDVLDALA
jgi:hypothetical protein